MYKYFGIFRIALIGLLTFVFVFTSCAPSLHDLVENKKYDEVQKKLDGGEDVNKIIKKKLSPRQAFKGSYTPLILSIKNEDIPMVELLINHGASIDTLNPIFDAAISGNIEIIKILVDKGADVNTKSSSGKTSLMYADKAEMVKYLIDNGANVNDTTDQGWTALIYACHRRDATDIVKLLLESGTNIEDVGGEKKQATLALSFAAHKDDVETVRLLLDIGASARNKDACEAAMFYRYEILKILAEGGARLENCRFKELPYLNHPASEGNLEVVRLLLDMGADVNSQTGAKILQEERRGVQTYFTLKSEKRFGMNALMEAVINNHPAIVKLLLDHGADPNLKVVIKDASLPFSSLPGYDVSIKKGSGVERKEEWATSLEMATKLGNNELITLLKEYLVKDD